jgi:hypothetical protein
MRLYGAVVLILVLTLPRSRAAATSEEAITAWSTLALAVVTLMLVVVTAALAYYAYRASKDAGAQLRRLDEQTQTAREQLAFQRSEQQASQAAARSEQASACSVVCQVAVKRHWFDADQQPLRLQSVTIEIHNYSALPIRDVNLTLWHVANNVPITGPPVHLPIVAPVAADGQPETVPIPDNEQLNSWELSNGDLVAVGSFRDAAGRPWRWRKDGRVEALARPAQQDDWALEESVDRYTQAAAFPEN